MLGYIIIAALGGIAAGGAYGMTRNKAMLPIAGLCTLFWLAVYHLITR